MRLLSVCTGLPSDVTWRERIVNTSIFKKPVTARVILWKLNLEGDKQADLTVHGGEYKAVYCYPVEHYEYWRQELPGRGLPHGSSGENFTVEGLSDDSVAIGDRFVIGSAEMIVTQPRLPCYKLGVKFQSDDMVKRFLASCRTGFYFTVTREEEVGAGDEITKISNTSHSLPVAEITNLQVAKRFGEAEMSMARRALSAAALPDSWKGYFRGRLEKADA